jgi:hypothetical protein
MRNRERCPRRLGIQPLALELFRAGERADRVRLLCGPLSSVKLSSSLVSARLRANRVNTCPECSTLDAMPLSQVQSSGILVWHTPASSMVEDSKASLSDNRSCWKHFCVEFARVPTVEAPLSQVRRPVPGSVYRTRTATAKCESGNFNLGLIASLRWIVATPFATHL